MESNARCVLYGDCFKEQRGFCATLPALKTEDYSVYQINSITVLLVTYFVEKASTQKCIH